MKTILHVSCAALLATGLLAQPAPADSSAASLVRPMRTAVPLNAEGGPGTPLFAAVAPNRPAIPALPAVPGARGPRPNPAGANPPANPAAATKTSEQTDAENEAAAKKAVAAIKAANTNSVNTGKPDEEEIIPPGIIKFQDADLLQVLDIYQELTGRTVVRPNSLPATKISVRSQTSLTRKEAIQLLDTVLAMNQVTMIPQGKKYVKAVPEGTAGAQGAVFSDPDEGLDETTHYITKIVQLKNAIPRDVTQALAPLSKMQNSIMAIDSSGILVLRDYEENVKRMEELLEKIDVVPMNEYEPVVIPIKYALASDIAQVLSTLTAGGGGATTVGSHPAGTGLTTQSGLRGGTGGIGGYGGVGGVGGYGGVGGMGGVGGVGAYGTANTLGGAAGTGFGSPGAQRSSFQQRLGGIVNRAAQGAGAAGDIVVIGNTKVIADERTNSLLIFATKGDIDTITNIIAKLDVVLAQVLIEAIIMEVSLDNSLNYGISYLQKTPVGNNYASGIGAINNGTMLNNNNFIGGASNAVASVPSGFSYFANFGNDFSATATAIATDNRINVLSRPRIQTSHAVEANLFVGETRPYITGTYSYYGGAGPSSQYSQLQIGITLSVLPLINPDGLVVMDIRQKIQSIGGFTTIDNNQIPTTIDREANAKVAVRDKETVMLGGFISTDTSKNSSGVPLLKDIPILGNLFRSTAKTLSRKELMVLIRPTVLPTPQMAAIVAKEEKAKLPGISSAERENSRDERRQIKKLNAEELKEQKRLDQDELRDQKKLDAQQRKQQSNLDKDLYRREGFSN